MYPVKLHTKPVYLGFFIFWKLTELCRFCNLFMERPSYIVPVISILYDKVHHVFLISSMQAAMSGRWQT